jgi:hypothetical protein
METSILVTDLLNSFPFASSTHLSVDSRGAPPCAGLVVGASAQKTEFVCASSQTFRSTSAIIRMRHLHRRPTCEEY